MKAWAGRLPGPSQTRSFAMAKVNASKLTRTEHQISKLDLAALARNILCERFAPRWLRRHCHATSVRDTRGPDRPIPRRISPLTIIVDLYVSWLKPTFDAVVSNAVKIMMRLWLEYIHSHVLNCPMTVVWYTARGWFPSLLVSLQITKE